MGREEALTYLLTVQSGLMAILLSVQVSLIPVQAQKPSLCVSYCQMLHSKLISYLKSSNAVITHSAMVLQNLFVLKLYRSFLLLQFPNIIYSMLFTSSMESPMNAG